MKRWFLANENIRFVSSLIIKTNTFKHPGITLTYKVIGSHIKILKVYHFSSTMPLINIYFTAILMHVDKDIYAKIYFISIWTFKESECQHYRNGVISCVFTCSEKYATTTKKKKW